MARKKQQKEIIEVAQEEKTIIVRAIRPLTEDEHEQLSRKLKFEQEQTGVKVILLPFLVDKDDVQ